MRCPLLHLGFAMCFWTSVAFRGEVSLHRASNRSELDENLTTDSADPEVIVDGKPSMEGSKQSNPHERLSLRQGLGHAVSIIALARPWLRTWVSTALVWVNACCAAEMTSVIVFLPDGCGLCRIHRPTQPSSS